MLGSFFYLPFSKFLTTTDVIVSKNCPMCQLYCRKMKKKDICLHIWEKSSIFAANLQNTNHGE